MEEPSAIMWPWPTFKVTTGNHLVFSFLDDNSSVTQDNSTGWYTVRYWVEFIFINDFDLLLQLKVMILDVCARMKTVESF